MRSASAPLVECRPHLRCGGFDLSTKDRQNHMLTPNRQNYLQLKSSSASQDIKQFHLQLNGWIMQMEEALTRRVNNLTLDHLQRVASLLLQGMDIADTIRNTVSTIINLHGKLSKVN